MTNFRNYYLRFPTPTPAVKFNYAVLATWKGTEPSDQPTNAPEVVAGTASTTESTIYYVDDNTKGGNFVLSFGIGGYCTQPSTIFIESGLFNLVKTIHPSDYCIGGGDNYSTYQVELQPDVVTRCGDYDVRIIGQYPNFNYLNDYGAANNAGSSPLEAYYRTTVKVSNVELSWVKVTTPNGGELWIPGAPGVRSVDICESAGQRQNRLLKG